MTTTAQELDRLQRRHRAATKLASLHRSLATVIECDPELDAVTLDGFDVGVARLQKEAETYDALADMVAQSIDLWQVQLDAMFTVVASGYVDINEEA